MSTRSMSRCIRGSVSHPTGAGVTPNDASLSVGRANAWERSALASLSLYAGRGLWRGPALSPPRDVVLEKYPLPRPLRAYREREDGRSDAMDPRAIQRVSGINEAARARSRAGRCVACHGLPADDVSVTPARRVVAQLPGAAIP